MGEVDRIQPVFVGTDREFAAEFFKLLAGRGHDGLVLAPEDWGRTTWQRARTTGRVWVVIRLHRANDVELLTRWTQLLAVALRPTRLVICTRTLRLPDILLLSRLGADGFVAENATAAELLDELEQPVAERETLLPDPTWWLSTLTRASEELLASADPRDRLRKLLRIFKAQLSVDRASVVLLERGKVMLAAGIGMPEGLKDGMELPVSEGSVLRWVLDNKRPRLIQGSLQSSSRPDINSAICAPLLARGELLGAVSFTSFGTGSNMGQADLATAEVFASMLAFAIANSRLLQANLRTERLATIGQTTAMVSHCVKNNMQSILGGVFLARRGAESGDRELLERSISMIDAAGERLRGIVLDLLDYAKDRDPEPEPARPRAILEEIRDVVVRSSPQVKLAVDLDCRDEAECYVDRGRLVRALVNLGQNACEAIGDEGVIQIGYRREGGEAVFTVADSGPGATAEVIEQMFDPFFSTKGGKGTGLGLAMVEKFVRECGGKVFAENCDDPGGLKVTIRIPAEAGIRFAHKEDNEPSLP